MIGFQRGARSKMPTARCNADDLTATADQHAAVVLPVRDANSEYEMRSKKPPQMEALVISDVITSRGALSPHRPIDEARFQYLAS